MRQDRIIRNTIENLVYIHDVLAAASERWERSFKDRANNCAGEMLKIINDLERMEQELETRQREERLRQQQEDEN